MQFISSKTHTIIGLVVGVALLLAPYLFGFSDNEVASYVTMGIGIFVILSELITTSQLSLVKLVPMRVHLMLDYATGVFLALSPWIFGFNETVWLPHVIVGTMTVGYAVLTDPTSQVEKSTAE